jgi:long-subunit acyl-CoA synthetase (AMP-forming)
VGKNFSRIIMASFALFMALMVSVPAQAQYGRRDRNRGYTKTQVEQIIRRLENQTDRFVRSFDRSLDNSRADGTIREDNLNQRARDMENALDVLRQEFDRTDRYQDTRSQVSNVLSIAENINRAVRNRRLRGNTERLWAQVRNELNYLASVYNLRQLR